MNEASTYPRFRGFPPLKDPNSIPRGPVLAFAPHPDDEIIGCGGTLAFHADRGDEVVVAHMTGGEQGDPGHHEQDDLVGVRRRESRDALEILGVHQLECLGFPDGAVTPDPGAIQKVQALIDARAPVVVYAPSPLECHPDHLATSWMVGQALRASPLQAELYCYEVNHPTMASFLLDFTPRVDRKREALAAFASQQRYQDIVGKCLAGAYARTVNIAMPEFQYAEAFLALDADDLENVWRDLEALSRRLGIVEEPPAEEGS